METIILGLMNHSFSKNPFQKALISYRGGYFYIQIHVNLSALFPPSIKTQGRAKGQPHQRLHFEFIKLPEFETAY